MWHNNELCSTVTLAALVLMCNSHSLSLMPFLRVLPKRREWLSPSQIIVQIPLLLTCNVKQVAFCVGYINGLDVGDTPRLYVSFRGEENELASLSVCECMCGCAYDVCCSPDDMRLAEPSDGGKRLWRSTLWNMCCGWVGWWEGEMAQHASHHCKHVRA